MRPMTKVFFSQSISDPRRYAIHSILKSYFGDENVWLAEFNINPQDKWPENSIKRFMAACSIFIVLIPPEFSVSVLAECAYALILNKHILSLASRKDADKTVLYQLGTEQPLILEDSTIECQLEWKLRLMRIQNYM